MQITGWMNGAGRQNAEEKRVQNNDKRCFYPPLSQYNWRPEPSNLLERLLLTTRIPAKGPIISVYSHALPYGTS